MQWQALQLQWRFYSPCLMVVLTAEVRLLRSMTSERQPDAVAAAQANKQTNTQSKPSRVAAMHRSFGLPPTGRRTGRNGATLVRSVPGVLRCAQTPRSAAHTTDSTVDAGGVSVTQGGRGFSAGPGGRVVLLRTFALLGRVCDDSQVHGLDLPTERMCDAARRGPVHEWERLIGNGAKWERG